MRKYNIKPVYHNFPKEDMYFILERTLDGAILRSAASIELLMYIAVTELNIWKYEIEIL